MDDDFDRGQFGAQDAHHSRKPIHLITGQKADRERWPRWLCCAARRLAGRLDLQQRHPRVIEKHAPRCGQFDAAGTAVQKLDPKLPFEIVNLPAQRRLRRMQPLLRRNGQAAFLGNRDEVSKVAQLHLTQFLKSMALTLQSLSPGCQHELDVR